MVESLGRGRFAIVQTEAGGSGQTIRRVRLAHAAPDRGVVWVFLDGRTYRVALEAHDATDAGRVADDQVALAAPMPATVVAVEVEAGQQVAAGDLLVLLEAMKMEVPIRAPRPGRVRSIACREGELVQPGIPLLELD